VPGVAVLAAAAQAREGVDAARLEPGEEVALKLGVWLTLKPP
jgi:hypothetical protein